MSMWTGEEFEGTEFEGTAATVLDPFEVLADPVRRRIVEVLASGGQTAGELAGVVGAEFRIARPSVSRHLGILRRGGFVQVIPDERFRIYYLLEDGIEVLEDAVAQLRRLTRVGVGSVPGWRSERTPFGSEPRSPGFGPLGTTRRGRRGRTDDVYEHACYDTAAYAPL